MIRILTLALGVMLLGFNAFAGCQLGPNPTNGLLTCLSGATGSGGGMADPGANGIVVRTALDTTTSRTITEGFGISVTNGSGVSGNPTVASDTAVMQTLANDQSGAARLCSGSASTTATCTMTPTLTAYTTGMTVEFLPGASNTTTYTLQIDGLAGGGKSILTCAAGALAANDIVSGRQVKLTYDGTQFRLPCSGGFSNPMTTQGDLITGGSSGAAGRLAVGTSGQGLVSDGTNPGWGDVIRPFSSWLWMVESWPGRRANGDGFGVLGWANEGQGTETIQADFTSTGGYPEVKMQTGTTSGDSAILNLHQSSSGRMSFALGSTSPFTTGWEARWRVYTDSAVTNRIMSVGFRSANSDTEYRVNSAVYVRFDTANPACGSGSGSGTTWVLEKYTGSASTCADTGVTVSANTEYTIRLYSTTLGTVNAQVSTNGGAFSSAVNVTSLFTTQVAPYWQLETSTTAAAYMYARRWEFVGK